MREKEEVEELLCVCKSGVSQIGWVSGCFGLNRSGGSCPAL